MKVYLKLLSMCVHSKVLMVSKIQPRCNQDLCPDGLVSGNGYFLLEDLAREKQEAIILYAACLANGCYRFKTHKN